MLLRFKIQLQINVIIEGDVEQGLKQRLKQVARIWNLLHQVHEELLEKLSFLLLLLKAEQVYDVCIALQAVREDLKVWLGEYQRHKNILEG